MGESDRRLTAPWGEIEGDGRDPNYGRCCALCQAPIRAGMRYAHECTSGSEQASLVAVGRVIAKRIAERLKLQDAYDVGVLFEPVGARETFRAKITFSGMASLMKSESERQRVAVEVWTDERAKHPHLFDRETRREHVNTMQQAQAENMGDEELAAALGRLRGGE